MDNKDKSILQIHLITDKFILPYIVDDFLWADYFAAHENEDIAHNVRYNHRIAIEDAVVGVKISRNLLRMPIYD